MQGTSCTIGENHFEGDAAGEASLTGRSFEKSRAQLLRPMGVTGRLVQTRTRFRKRGEKGTQAVVETVLMCTSSEPATQI